MHAGSRLVAGSRVLARAYVIIRRACAALPAGASKVDAARLDVRKAAELGTTVRRALDLTAWDGRGTTT